MLTVRTTSGGRGWMTRRNQLLELLAEVPLRDQNGKACPDEPGRPFHSAEYSKSALLSGLVCRGLLWSVGATATLAGSAHEALDLATRVHEALVAREEGVALGANIYAHVRLRRTRSKRIAACAVHVGFDVFWMNSCFHVLSLWRLSAVWSALPWDWLYQPPRGSMRLFRDNAARPEFMPWRTR
jgi:hypothetical protein